MFCISPIVILLQVHYRFFILGRKVWEFLFWIWLFHQIPQIYNKRLGIGCMLLWRVFCWFPLFLEPIIFVDRLVDYLHGRQSLLITDGTLYGGGAFLGRQWFGFIPISHFDNFLSVGVKRKMEDSFSRFFRAEIGIYSPSPPGSDCILFELCTSVLVRTFEVFVRFRYY